MPYVIRHPSALFLSSASTVNPLCNVFFCEAAFQQQVGLCNAFEFAALYCRYYLATVDEILDDGSCSVIFDKYGTTEVTQVGRRST